jgi:hypothetical protein
MSDDTPTKSPEAVAPGYALADLPLGMTKKGGLGPDEMATKLIDAGIIPDVPEGPGSRKKQLADYFASLVRDFKSQRAVTVEEFDKEADRAIKALCFMCSEDQNRLRDAVKKIVMARLGRTYYGIPKGKIDPFDRLLRIWPHLPESLKTELRHILAPAFRKKVVIVKDERLMQEVDDFFEEFSQVEE